MLCGEEFFYIYKNLIFGTSAEKESEIYIPENIFYKLCFKAKNETARKFQDFVTDKVLPSIRKTGGYIAGEEKLSEEELVLKAMQVLNNKVKNLRKEVYMKEQVIEKQKSKVNFANNVMASKNCISVNNLAKFLKQNGCDVGQNRLFEWLRNKGYLTSKKGIDYNTPTQRSMDLGIFIIKESTFTKPNGETFTTKTSLVTGKGQFYLFNKYVEDLNK